MPVAMALLLGACSRDSSPVTPPVGGTDTVLVSAVLRDLALGVVTSTYADLARASLVLNDRIVSLAADPTEKRLEDARSAWRAARTPWEQSEGFLFGPVDSKGIDPRIDSWPLNRIDLDAVLAGSMQLTKAYVDQLENTQRGFHAIEYLLFGAGGDSVKTIGQMSARELEYAVAAAQSLAASAEQLRYSWASDGEFFANRIITAGAADNVYYSSHTAGLQEFVNGMIAICDEVGAGKINDPYSQKNRTLEESQFSNNSIADFADNVLSVKNVYLGSYNTFKGNGIGAIVASVDPQLHARVTAEIEGAYSAILNMTPSFGRAIFENPGAVERAMAALLKLRVTLESDVLPIINEVK